MPAWECPDCGTSVVHAEGEPIKHHCRVKADRLARAFERVVDTPKWVEQAGPTDELRTLVERTIGHTGIEVEYVVAYSTAERVIVRRVHVTDPSLPPPHNKQVKELHHLDDWEPVLRDLGLTP